MKQKGKIKMPLKSFTNYKKQLTKLKKKINVLETKLKEKSFPKKREEIKLSLRKLKLKKVKLNHDYRYCFCSHPLWYLNNIEDNQEKVYWNCTCLVCEKKKRAPQEEFKNVIPGFDNSQKDKSPFPSFAEVKKAYNKLYNVGKIDEEVVGRILVKRFKEKTN